MKLNLIKKKESYARVMFNILRCSLQ